jgi:hypothetical protein
MVGVVLGAIVSRVFDLDRTSWLQGLKPLPLCKVYGGAEAPPFHLSASFS